MSTPRLLNADLREPARILIATGRLRVEHDPVLYRTAVSGQRELASFFRNEFDWAVEVLDSAGLIRLHKRRTEVPADRGPRLDRKGRTGALAPVEVLVLVALVCEQLWRRPKTSLHELMQAIAQVCAHESRADRLPPFRIVASDGIGRHEAQQHRRFLVDALKLLVAEGTITVDSDLDRAAADDQCDLVVTAAPERIAAKFSCLPPSLLGLDDRHPGEHVAALCTESPDRLELDDREDGPRQRRLEVMRRLVDDPAVDPFDDRDDTRPAYLHTSGGRERALGVLASLGYTVTVRRDWWEVTDPAGVGTGLDFPAGRRIERQAALAVLAELARRQDSAISAPVSAAAMIAIFTRIRQDLPRWAAVYGSRLTSLARAAAEELVHAGLLTADPEDHDLWHPTPGVHLWRVRTSTAHVAQKAEPTEQGATATALFDLESDRNPS